MYAFQCIIFEEVPEDFCQGRQDDRSTDVRGVCFACDQEQDKDETVQESCRSEASDRRAGQEIDESRKQGQDYTYICIAHRVNNAARGSKDECVKVGNGQKENLKYRFHIQ